MKKKLLILSTFSIFPIFIDQVIKIYVHNHFQLGESISVIPGYFNITYVRNFGAAFGFLADSHPQFREVFFLLIPPIALVIIGLMIRSTKESHVGQLFALSSIFGGAIGNYIDRIRFRYVIDFIDVHYRDFYTWPAFNIADSAIVCGVIALMILSFLDERAASKESSAT